VFHTEIFVGSKSVYLLTVDRLSACKCSVEQQEGCPVCKIVIAALIRMGS